MKLILPCLVLLAPQTLSAALVYFEWSPQSSTLIAGSSSGGQVSIAATISHLANDRVEPSIKSNVPDALTTIGLEDPASVIALIDSLNGRLPLLSITFSSPLPPGSYIGLQDVDNGESYRIRGDSDSILTLFSQVVDSSGPADPPSYDATHGIITSATPPGPDNNSDWTLFDGGGIQGLNLEMLTAGGDIGTNSVFLFAVVPSTSIPEPEVGHFALLGLAICFRRIRRQVSVQRPNVEEAVIRSGDLV